MKTKTNWQNLQLQDISKIITGKTPSKKRADFFGGNIPFAKPGDLDKNKYIETTEDTLTESGLTQISTLPPNTVLVSCIGNLGKKALLKGAGGCNQQINAILPSPYIEPLFIYYYIDILKPWLVSHASATTVTILNKNTFATAPIPVPPMAEQKRIVKKIEELFGVIDEQVKRLEATHAALVSYRQSILHSLFSSAIGEKVPLEKCLNYLQPTPYIVKSTDYMEAGEVPVLTPGKTFILGFTKEKEGIFTNPLPVIIFDDFTTSTKLVDFPFKVKSSAMKILLAKEGVDIRYIYYIMQILSCPHDTHKRYWISIYAKMRIILPSLPEQKAIVKKIENAFAFADKAQATITGALEQVKQLKQSILKRAFEGKLVPQDPNDKPVDLTQIKKDKHK